MLGRKLSLLTSLLTIPFLLLFSAEALAAITFTSAIGASLVDTTGSTTGSSSSTTTATTPLIYGGMAGTCTTSSNTSTCDSCATATSLTACNPNNISVNTNLVLTFATTDTSATLAPEVRATSSTGTILDTSPVWSRGATTITTTIPWSTLCANFSTGSSTGCTSDGTVDIWVGFQSASGATSYTSVRVIFRYVSTTTNYVDCANGNDSNTENAGFCHFTTFPGDAKIYANDMWASANFPSSPNTSSKYTNIVFFYQTQDSSDADDAATLARVTSASQRFSLAVQTSLTPPVADDRITDLSNGTRYCLVMANQDATGIINFFTPSSLYPAAGAQSDLCTTPEPVAGLLDDKHCFIATAAFGSDMAPEVQSFRDFRNKFLLPFSWGKKFVKLYYKYSPQYAEMISGNEVAKTVARIALWPLLVFARMSVALGFWISLLLLSASIAMIIVLCERLMRKNRIRGEL